MFNFESPFNNLSFGNVSFGITYELFKLGISPNIFPIGGNVDLGVFDKVGDDYKSYLNSCIGKGLKNFKKETPFLKLWHINGSHLKISEPSNLLTFYELNKPTAEEINILNSFKNVFVTSSHSKRIFESAGITANIHKINIGFDSLHFNRIDKKFYENGVTWGIFGKFEQRKHTKKAIQTWIKKFGKNSQHRLHLHITNPFFKPEQMNAVYGDIFNNQPPPFNVIIYGFQNNNSLFNQCINACDIVIDMSGAETISIPSLTAVCLGKHAVLHKAPGIEDWATPENSVLVEPCGMQPAYDNTFFFAGAPFNQGEIFTWNEDDFLAACDTAIDRFNKNPLNVAGQQLIKDYNYAQGVKDIIKVINS